MNISAVTLETVNANYRVRLPLSALQGLGHGTYLDEGSSIQRPDILMRSDAVLFYRHWDRHARRMARRLREAGVGVIVDNDDDLAGVTRDIAGYWRTGGIRAHHLLTEMGAMMREAHLVTATTDALAARFAELTPTPVRAIDNYLPIDWFQRPDRRSDRVVIGWVAANEHKADYQRLQLGEVFERLLERHPHLHIVSIGLGLGLRSDRYRHVQPIRFLELTRRVAEWDIGIAPLADIPFSRGRSAIKLKEYAAAELPWVASDIGPYRGLGPEQGGLVISNDRWFKTLDQLVKDDRSRERLTLKSASWARTQTIPSHAAEWHDAFAAAAAIARGRPIPPPTTRAPSDRRVVQILTR